MGIFPCVPPRFILLPKSFKLLGSILSGLLVNRWSFIQDLWEDIGHLERRTLEYNSWVGKRCGTRNSRVIDHTGKYCRGGRKNIVLITTANLIQFDLARFCVDRNCLDPWKRVFPALFLYLMVVEKSGYFFFRSSRSFLCELSHPKFADMPWVTPQRSSLWWLRVEKHHPEVASENLDKSGQCESVRYPSVGNMLGSICNSFHKLLGPPSQGRIPTGALDAAKVKSYPAARLWRFLTKPGTKDQDEG